MTSDWTRPTRSRASEWETVPARRPGVFWVMTGFGIPSAGRGHAVETGMLEPVPRRGPILLLLLLPVLFVLLLSLTPPPLRCQLQCVSQLAQNQTAPSEEFTPSLPPFSLFHFLPSFFPFAPSLSLFFCLPFIILISHSFPSSR